MRNQNLSHLIKYSIDYCILLYLGQTTSVRPKMWWICQWRMEMKNPDLKTAILFLCNGFRWPLFFFLHQQFTVLINYLCILDTTLRILNTQWNYMLYALCNFYSLSTCAYTYNVPRTYKSGTIPFYSEYYHHIYPQAGFDPPK